MTRSGVPWSGNTGFKFARFRHDLVVAKLRVSRGEGLRNVAAAEKRARQESLICSRILNLLDAPGQDTLGTMKFDIDLTTAQAERLRQEAERLKITPEELARAAVADLLSERDQDFKVAAERVLEKYSELYRRLA